jgi:hypothetical protein
MTGRTRLPGGEPRKASQRNKRNVSSSGAAKITPTWQPGARVHWKDRVGTFRRDLGDGENAESSSSSGSTGCGLGSWGTRS